MVPNWAYGYILSGWVWEYAPECPAGTVLLLQHFPEKGKVFYLINDGHGVYGEQEKK